MAALRRWPSAMTIAGSDSGGGAGVQADLKVFAALNVHGTCAVTCVTAQNPGAVRGVHAVPAVFVERQIESVIEVFRPNAIKTGMLLNRSIIERVAGWFERGRRPPLIVDPVMVASSGAELLRPGARKALLERLAPLSALITPNLAEAEVMWNRRIGTVDDLMKAAQGLHERLGCAVLIKGGHVGGNREVLDVFYDGRIGRTFRAKRIRGVDPHGTGCTYAAAIAARVASGLSLVEAIESAKETVIRAIIGRVRSGKGEVLGVDYGKGV